MKTIEITKATKSLSEYATELGEESVVVVKRGKPVAILSSVRGMDAESIALSRNPKFVAIIKRSRLRHSREGGIGIEEVRRRLGLGKPAAGKPRAAKRESRGSA